MTQIPASRVRGRQFLRHVPPALCALLCLLLASSPTPGADAKSMTAMLLVASSGLEDSSFGDSVVLVLNNLGPAPVGLIVNRPTRLPISEIFPDLKRLGSLHERVYFGGPVEMDTLWFVFRATKPPEHAVLAFDGVCISASRELLLRLLARDKPMDGLRIFVGHSGWAPGQLESEIARGDWKLERAEPDAIFNNKSEHPWPTPREPGNST